jgi:hypothetical protein
VRRISGKKPRHLSGGRGNLIGLLQQYAGYMLCHFGGPAPAEYLSRHPDEYVVAVRLPLRPADMPRRPDGSVDIEAFPERIFGPGHVKRHPDGSTEYIDIPESKFRELDQRVLHRAGDELVGGSCGGRAAGGLVVGLGQAGAARLALARNAQTDAGSK